VGKTLELLGKLLMQQNINGSYTFFQLGTSTLFSKNVKLRENL